MKNSLIVMLSLIVPLVALKIMKQNNIEVNDLYSFVLPRMSKLQLPNNVHFTETGSQALAEEVAQAIIMGQTDELNYKKGNLIYSNSLSSDKDVSGWIMEGPGAIEFKDGWMHMQSPDEKGHHVFWCPIDFPGSFVAEWELQNLETDAGLCIIFFAARGVNGEDIFDPSLPERDGVFRKYTKGELNNYHISYYANGKDKPGREISHLRKNKGFEQVLTGEPGIPVNSSAIHKMKLIKDDAHILMYVDERKIIDWIDDGKKFGPVWQEGKMGFRQMEWTHFRYRNFKVWELD